MNPTEQTYWQNFYASFEESAPSSFAQFVNEFLIRNRKEGVRKLLDIGCGNGRDSYFFAESGHEVTGIDVSNKPTSTDRCEFFVRDMTSFSEFDAYDMLYSRFTFHSITDAQQETLLRKIQRPGILLCIETRSVKGSETKCVHGNDSHYRNLTDTKRLERLLSQHHFEILYFEENTGFAKYKDEDPVCIRVICQKRMVV